MLAALELDNKTFPWVILGKFSHMASIIPHTYFGSRGTPVSIVQLEELEVSMEEKYINEL